MITFVFVTHFYASQMSNSLKMIALLFLAPCGDAGSQVNISKNFPVNVEIEGITIPSLNTNDPILRELIKNDSININPDVEEFNYDVNDIPAFEDDIRNLKSGDNNEATIPIEELVLVIDLPNSNTDIELPLVTGNLLTNAMKPELITLTSNQSKSLINQLTRNSSLKSKLRVDFDLIKVHEKYPYRFYLSSIL